MKLTKWIISILYLIIFVALFWASTPTQQSTTIQSKSGTTSNTSTSSNSNESLKSNSQK